jgi:hypothetical protein
MHIFKIILWRLDKEISACWSLMVSGGMAFAGGPVVIADEPEIAAAAAPAGQDWTGFYVGL